jgi:hypothetical protein
MFNNNTFNASLYNDDATTGGTTYYDYDVAEGEVDPVETASHTKIANEAVSQDVHIEPVSPGAKNEQVTPDITYEKVGME